MRDLAWFIDNDQIPPRNALAGQHFVHPNVDAGEIPSHMIEVVQERIRAHYKHDPDPDSEGASMERLEFDHPMWLPVLIEEGGEVAKAIIEDNIYRHRLGEAPSQNLRKELIQVMAMCSAWIDAIDMHEVAGPAPEPK